MTVPVHAEMPRPPFGLSATAEPDDRQQEVPEQVPYHSSLGMSRKAVRSDRPVRVLPGAGLYRVTPDPGASSDAPPRPAAHPLAGHPQPHTDPLPPRATPPGPERPP